MANTYLTRTPSSASNRKTFTWSGWIKRSQLGATNTLFTSGYSSNAVASLRFNASDKLDVFDYNSSTQFAVVTNRLFRDTSAWYHIVMRVDTTQSTANDRVRLYVNGEQETSLTTNTQPSQNYDTLYNNTIAHYIGRYGWTNADSFNGSMSHIHFCDGQSYAPTEFGETDATTGEWKIKTSPSVTYGTNGFFILKDGNSVTDQSGNGNNFTVGSGTLTKTEDCPSNVFATLNSLTASSSSGMSNGNLKYENSTGDFDMRISTLAATSGKYYFEAKIGAVGTWQIGILDVDQFQSGYYISGKSRGYIYGSVGEKVNNNSAVANWGDSFTTGDIIGIALDLDNNKVYASKNGTFQASGDPTSGATGTGAMYSVTDGYYYAFGITSNDSGTNSTCEVNFGNGYFGTTAITTNSGNGYAGAEGSSIFNYQPPTGYSALSTKGLNL